MQHTKQASGMTRTLARIILLGEAAFSDSLALVVEPFGAGHARGRRASGRRSAPRAARWAVRRSSRVPRAIGVVAWPPLHLATRLSARPMREPDELVGDAPITAAGR
jgi:hypothetical protein